MVMVAEAEEVPFKCEHFPLLEAFDFPPAILRNYARLTHPDHPSHLGYRAELERMAGATEAGPEPAAEAEGASSPPTPTPGAPGLPPDPATTSPQRPTLVGMVASAATAAAKFVGGGCQTVSAEVLADRLAVCGGCDHYSGSRCDLCGCYTAAKLRLPAEACPIGKWPAVDF